MDVRTITSEKDLRRLRFSEIFYELYDAPDQKQACMGVIGQLDSNAPKKIADALDEALKLDILIEDLKAHETLCQRRNVTSCLSPAETLVHEYSNRVTAAIVAYNREPSKRAFSALEALRCEYPNQVAAVDEEFDRELSDRVAALDRATHQFRAAELTDDAKWSSSLSQTLKPSLKNVRHEFLEKIGTESEHNLERITSRPLATFYCTDKTRYNKLLQTIRQQQLDTLASVLENRTIKGIYTISLLATDQDLITYMGITFHASFQAVDAYTGLIYTARYYDNAAQRYEKVSTTNSIESVNHNYLPFAFSVEERRACEEKLQAAAQAKRLEREEREEAEQKIKDYAEAKRILKHDSPTASSLSTAVKLLVKLGEYEDSPKLLKQARGRHAETEKRERFRADLCRRAQQLMPRIGWYGDIGSLECRQHHESPRLPKPDTTRTTGWNVLHCDVNRRRVYLWTQDSIAEPEGNAPKLAKVLDMALFGTLPLEVRIRARKWASLNALKLKDPDLRLFVPTTDITELSGKWQNCEPIDPNSSRVNHYKKKKYAYLIYDPDRKDFCNSDDGEPVKVWQAKSYIRPVICLDFSLTDEELDIRRAEETQRDAYLNAFEHCEAGAWDAAQAEFHALGNYQDSERMAHVCRYMYLHNKAGKCKDEAGRLTCEDAEKAYRNAARIYLEAEAAESDAGFLDGRSIYKDSDRCLELARICHTSSLLKRIAKLKSEKEIISRDLETTPLERKQKNIVSSILQKRNSLSKLSLFDFSKRRDLKREIDSLTFEMKSLVQQMRDERADMEREAANKMAALRKKSTALRTELLANIKRGSTIYYGSKQHSSIRTTWRIANIANNTLLLIADPSSKITTIKQPYHSYPVEQITWKQCSLRTWLNTTYLSDTFTKQEQILIAPQRKSSSEDYIFILNAQELKSPHGTENYPPGTFWLRSHAKSPYTIAEERGELYPYNYNESKIAHCHLAVRYDNGGKIYFGGTKVVTDNSVAVLPCIVVNLEI